MDEIIKQTESALSAIHPIIGQLKNNEVLAEEKKMYENAARNLTNALNKFRAMKGLTRR